MIIRLAYLTSAFSLVTVTAASKSSKSSPTSPTDITGKSSKAKSGKSIGSKSSKTGEYFVLPFSCPGYCITEDAVKPCDTNDKDQMWKVHVDGTLLKFESSGLNDEGMCLAVKKACSGNLGLADCDDPETKWVDAGGLLLSAFCWSQGESAALSVDRGCTDLTVDDVAASTITTFNTFLVAAMRIAW